MVGCSGRAVRLSCDHKPAGEEEQERITGLGGYITADKKAIPGRVMGTLGVSRYERGAGGVNGGKERVR